MAADTTEKHPSRNNNDGEAVSNPESIGPAVGRAGHNVPYTDEKTAYSTGHPAQDFESRISLSHDPCRNVISSSEDGTQWPPLLGVRRDQLLDLEAFTSTSSSFRGQLSGTDMTFSR